MEEAPLATAEVEEEEAGPPTPRRERGLSLRLTGPGRVELACAEEAPPAAVDAEAIDVAAEVAAGPPTPRREASSNLNCRFLAILLLCVSELPSPGGPWPPAAELRQPRTETETSRSPPACGALQGM